MSVDCQEQLECEEDVEADFGSITAVGDGGDALLVRFIDCKDKVLQNNMKKVLIRSSIQAYIGGKRQRNDSVYRRQKAMQRSLFS